MRSQPLGAEAAPPTKGGKPRSKKVMDLELAAATAELARLRREGGPGAAAAAKAELARLQTMAAAATDAPVRRALDTAKAAAATDAELQITWVPRSGLLVLADGEPLGRGNWKGARQG